MRFGKSPVANSLYIGEVVILDPQIWNRDLLPKNQAGPEPPQNTPPTSGASLAKIEFARPPIQPNLNFVEFSNLRVAKNPARLLSARTRGRNAHGAPEIIFVRVRQTGCAKNLAMHRVRNVTRQVVTRNFASRLNSSWCNTSSLYTRCWCQTWLHSCQHGLCHRLNAWCWYYHQVIIANMMLLMLSIALMS